MRRGQWAAWGAGADTDHVTPEEGERGSNGVLGWQRRMADTGGEGRGGGQGQVAGRALEHGHGNAIQATPKASYIVIIWALL